MYLTVVIPTYCEVSNIQEVALAVWQAIRNANLDGEIVVVDDDSPDGTAKKAQQLDSRLPIRVLVRHGRRDLSGAVIEGLRAARGEVVVVMDGVENGDGMLYRSDYRNPRRMRHIRDGLSKTFLIGEVHPIINHRVSWAYANNAYSTCAIPPNLAVQDGTSWENSGGFRSDHPNGLNFALVDGSVAFISSAVDLESYRAMATIAGRETASVGSL